MENALVLKKINKKFGEFWVVREVDADVPQNKITAFIGPNGAGKTTLFHIIAGGIIADGGQIILNGNNITGLPAYAVARQGIGRQFQDVRVFGGLTVLENILTATLPIKMRDSWHAWYWTSRKKYILKQCKEKAQYWLEYVGLYDHVNYLSRDLSFGQQRLLTLARLFAQGSNCLLLDEPTSGLGYNMIERVIELIHSAVDEHGVTVAIIEHNMSVVANLADWVYFMHEGKVTFSGQSQHVLTNQKVRETYMGL